MKIETASYFFPNVRLLFDHRWFQAIWKSLGRRASSAGRFFRHLDRGSKPDLGIRCHRLPFIHCAPRTPDVCSSVSKTRHKISGSRGVGLGTMLYSFLPPHCSKQDRTTDEPLYCICGIRWNGFEGMSRNKEDAISVPVFHFKIGGGEREDSRKTKGAPYPACRYSESSLNQKFNKAISNAALDPSGSSLASGGASSPVRLSNGKYGKGRTK